MTATWQILEGDALERLRDLDAGSVQTVVTSPPYYGLRDYGVDKQLGLEPTPEAYVARLVEAFAEVNRVLADDGTAWLNLGDTYAGARRGDTRSGFNERTGRAVGAGKQAGTFDQLPATPIPQGCKPKDLIGIPWMVAFALRAAGWYLRADVIWHKANAMPESVGDRPTRAHEYLFLLSKSASYYYDQAATREPHADGSLERVARGHRGDAHKYANGIDGEPAQPLHLTLEGALHPDGRNRRSVWTVPAGGYAGAHFATFPPKLIEPCILAGAPAGATVLDPFAGAGTTGLVALRHGRSFIGIELNPAYAQLARERILDDAPLLNDLAHAQ